MWSDHARLIKSIVAVSQRNKPSSQMAIELITFTIIEKNIWDRLDAWMAVKILLTLN